jgi:nitrogen-specific signal transduction histidine kinase
MSSAVNNPPEFILRVIDNGPGPHPEIVKRLFEPFVTGKREGVGLGLAVAQQIATSHGGAIVFHRAPGETCFEVHLPASNIQQLASSNNTTSHELIAPSLPTAH